tara:strand:- start:500 stop:1120 length:621 start_codon:yes stop_codon:yes gene_type:complete
MKEFERFFSDGGDEKILLNHDLNENSVVFEIGGHIGVFTEQIYNKFGCYTYVFEPDPQCFEILKNKFNRFEKINLFNFAMGSENESKFFHIYGRAGESSSEFTRDRSDYHKKIIVNFKKFSDILETFTLQQIDLCSINIEGGEYSLLEHIIASGYHHKVKNLQVQFHDDCVQNARQKRDAIRSELSKTHYLDYNYDFVWENWKINE